MAPPPRKGLTVYVFNVGQGDHLLIEFPSGEYGVIDFYHQSRPPINLHKSPALYFLEKCRAAAPSKPIRVRFIHLTHPDLDHTKGVIEFLEWVIKHKSTVKLREFWSFPGLYFKDVVSQFEKALKLLPTPNEELRLRAQAINNRLARLDELIRKTGCEEQIVSGIEHLGTIGKDTTAVAIAPLGSHIKAMNQKALNRFFALILQGKATPASDNNLMSSVLKFRYAGHQLLFGGDAGLRVWEDCLKFYRRTDQPHGNCQGNFIKVSHHGSKNSSSLKLWRALLCDDSRLAISAGRTKKPNHPDRTTLKDIIRAGNKFNSFPDVVSTNMCSECLDHPENTKLVNWYSAPDPKTKEEVKAVTREVRAMGMRQNLAPPEFAAYIYNFGPDEGRIKLTRALTAEKLTNSPCLFQKKPKQRFPKCVYR